MKRKSLLTVLLLAAILTSCSDDATPSVGEKLERFSDARYFSGYDLKSTFEKNEYNKKDIITFTFNEGTVFKGNENLQKKIMENAKNPGLGIRKLHKQGITGKGVNVAIIDQHLLLNHPEFEGKITEYFDTGCERAEGTGSMHAPAVTSLLVGNNIGVAPDARVYFAAVPSWMKDSKYFADALNWIVEKNRELPDGEKIRVVSVSAAPSGDGTPFEKNLELWDEAVLKAQSEGILVLDCRVGEKTGFIIPAYYDPDAPDDLSKCKIGFPSSPSSVSTGNFTIGVPNSYRTVAEEYLDGSPSYQYTGQAGLSWGIPYAAGVLALGWQVNPELDSEQIVQILFDTCYKNGDNQFINPPDFIKAVKKTIGDS